MLETMLMWYVLCRIYEINVTYIVNITFVILSKNMYSAHMLYRQSFDRKSVDK